MKRENVKWVLVLSLFATGIIQAQFKKEWFVYGGYSQSAQTIIDYSDPRLSRQILSYFRFTDFRQNIHFFYLGAEQHLKFSDSSKTALVWGVYFAKKGFKSNIDFISSGNEYLIKSTYALYYLNIPLYIQRKAFNLFYINYGITPSIMFYNRYDYVNDVKVLSANAHFQKEIHTALTDHYGEKEVNFVDLSIRLGVSYPLYQNKLFIDLNYDKGCINVNRNKVSALGYQNTWLLGIRYKI